MSEKEKKRFVSRTCIGEKCRVCGKPATNKVGEEIPDDDPYRGRHNLTAYLCAEHFDMIMKGKCNGIKKLTMEEVEGKKLSNCNSNQ